MTDRQTRVRVCRITAALAVCAAGSVCPAPTLAALPAMAGTETRSPTSASSKSWRFFVEDGFNIGFSCDLNPRSRGVIYYPQIATLAYIGPEFGINARTAGSRYITVGVAANAYIYEPIMRLSCGRQSRHSFVEVGLIAFPNIGNSDSAWNGPRVIPRLSLGRRF